MAAHSLADVAEEDTDIEGCDKQSQPLTLGSDLKEVHVAKSWSSFWKVGSFVLFVAGVLVFLYGHGSDVGESKKSSAHMKAGVRVMTDAQDSVKELHSLNASSNSSVSEDCHTALPGEPCYEAVLWAKWIGTIENPSWYSGKISRASNRHEIQKYLADTEKHNCKQPCPGKYPVPAPAAKAWPSIYCFSVARSGPEMDTMFMQRQSGTGIFGCDGFDVYSDQSIDIDGYQTKLIPSTAAGVSVDRTAANSQVFMQTWMDVLFGKAWYNYDFVVKADPDAILFPERLRWHVKPYNGQKVFFLNCAVYHPAMYGAVEVFSKASMGAYKAEHGRCQGTLPFWQWGEDKFMQECLKMLGVVPIGDYNNNVKDARCWGADCGNKGAVAFHPFKTVNSWYRCHLLSQT